MLLMMLTDLVIEKVLFVSKCFTTADVFQEKQSESGGYYITIQRYQFNGRLTSVIYRERIVSLVLISRTFKMKL